MTECSPGCAFASLHGCALLRRKVTTMNKAKNFVLATGALLILVSVLALVTQSPTHSQGQGFTTLPVTVMNGSTLPIPVVGSIGISGTPTVGISGTPSVSLVSGGKVGIDPANNSVSINNLPPVQLATTATNPALVREVE